MRRLAKRSRNVKDHDPHGWNPLASVWHAHRRDDPHCKICASKNADIYATNIEQKTTENSDYRNVLFTGKNEQLVVMSLKPREEIGME